jgi:tetratricopeptide (TPR) repeat protein
MSDAQVTQLLAQGIAAAKAKRNEEARQALLQVVDLDQRNEQAWLWLSGVVESLDERRTCLENVLAINPNNAHAQAGLRWLDQHAPPPPPEPAPPPAAPPETAFEAPPEPAPSPVVEAPPEPVPPPVVEAPPEPVPEAVPVQDLCPHCGNPVPPSGTECPYCGQPLIVACPNCGQYTDVTQTTCPNCGQQLGNFRDGAPYYLGLAQAYLAGRKLDRAVEAIGRAEAESPSDAQMVATAAGLYMQANRPDSAIAAYRRAIDLSPKDASLYAHLGALYRQSGKPADARTMYERAARLAGDDPEILFELARLQIEEEGVTRGALTLLQRAIQRDPTHVRMHLLLGDAYASQQNRQQAFKYYDRACQLTTPDTELGLEARRKLMSLQHASQQQAEAAQVEAAGPPVAELRHRPGCVTLYAVLVFLGGLGGILVAVLSGVGLIAGSGLLGEAFQLPSQVDTLNGMAPLGLALGASAGVTLFFSVLYLALAIGLWRMKNWARVVVIILQILGLLGSLASAGLTIGLIRETFTAQGPLGFPPVLLISLVVGLIIEVYVIFWFLFNRERFD